MNENENPEIHSCIGDNGWKDALISLLKIQRMKDNDTDLLANKINAK